MERHNTKNRWYRKNFILYFFCGYGVVSFVMNIVNYVIK